MSTEFGDMEIIDARDQTGSLEWVAMVEDREWKSGWEVVMENAYGNNALEHFAGMVSREMGTS